jgi:hypothetical protein
MHANLQLEKDSWRLHFGETTIDERLINISIRTELQK